MTVSQPSLVTDVNAAFILEALRAWHSSFEEVFFEELRLGTGFGPGMEGRIDAWTMKCWPSLGYCSTAYEIKVSRSDFLGELKKPQKRRRALLWSNYFFFATPAGLLQRDEIPLEAGLVEIDRDGKVHVVVEAIRRETMFPTWAFVASIARRVAK